MDAISDTHPPRETQTSIRQTHKHLSERHALRSTVCLTHILRRTFGTYYAAHCANHSKIRVFKKERKSSQRKKERQTDRGKRCAVAEGCVCCSVCYSECCSVCCSVCCSPHQIDMTVVKTNPLQAQSATKYRVANTHRISLVADHFPQKSH